MTSITSCRPAEVVKNSLTISYCFALPLEVIGICENTDSGGRIALFSASSRSLPWVSRPSFSEGLGRLSARQVTNPRRHSQIQPVRRIGNSVTCLRRERGHYCRRPTGVRAAGNTIIGSSQTDLKRTPIANAEIFTSRPARPRADQLPHRPLQRLRSPRCERSAINDLDLTSAQDDQAGLGPLRQNAADHLAHAADI